MARVGAGGGVEMLEGALACRVLRAETGIGTRAHALVQR